MRIPRQQYLNKLIASEGNGLIKIIAGIRRSGKSFLLFELFHQYLIDKGIEPNHIIEISLDHWKSKPLRDPDLLLNHIDNLIQPDGKRHYVILDEVQLVNDFVEVLLSLMQNRQLDIYVSGSNSKFLSSDIVTEFRGRGEEIHVYPLSFKEYFEVVGGDRNQAWKNYYTFGGLPQILQFETDEKKIDYLLNLYELTYFRDIIERNHLRNPDGMKQVIQVLASGIGAPTNPKRISNTFQTIEHIVISDKTIGNYIQYLEDAFIIEKALRYDVKGRKYIGVETKYYFADMGLRGAILNFRQQEEPHIMENIIYNELRMRGYRVDVGRVDTWGRDNNGKTIHQALEVDFVVNKGAERIYIQSAYRMPTEEKENQEKRSLLNTGDNFRKVIIVGDDIKRKVDEQGVVTISLFDFLLNLTEV
ncbi:MAG: ATP-binding protein [Paludibacteraceae bacterium]|nr:ATP-binding protein [Paludibacteraceae bacterium]